MHDFQSSKFSRFSACLAACTRRHVRTTQNEATTTMPKTPTKAGSPISSSNRFVLADGATLHAARVVSLKRVLNPRTSCASHTTILFEMLSILQLVKQLQYHKQQSKDHKIDRVQRLLLNQPLTLSVLRVPAWVHATRWLQYEPLLLG